MSQLTRVPALLALVLAGGVAAQEPRVPFQPPPIDSQLSGVEITVPKIIERTRYGMTTSEISMSVRVSYRDLDMATAAGVKELDRRVDRAADYLCNQLERMYPEGSPARRDCAARAVHDAQPQVILARKPS